jgi:hypothetical protein
MTETAVAQHRRWIALVLLCVAEFMVAAAQQPALATSESI